MMDQGPGFDTSSDPGACKRRPMEAAVRTAGSNQATAQYLLGRSRQPSACLASSRTRSYKQERHDAGNEHRDVCAKRPLQHVAGPNRPPKCRHRSADRLCGKNHRCHELSTRPQGIFTFRRTTGPAPRFPSNFAQTGHLNIAPIGVSQQG
jgi:hypothetical protein